MAGDIRYINETELSHESSNANGHVHWRGGFFSCPLAFAEGRAMHFMRLTQDSAGQVPTRGEPYEWKTIDGKTLNHGVTDAQGHALVSRVVGVRDYALETPAIRWQLHVDDACWTAAAADITDCTKLTGSTGKALLELDTQERTRDAALAEAHTRAIETYRRAASVNQDELSWLGAMPPQWSDEDYRRKLAAANTALQRAIGGWVVADTDISGFTCQLPEAFGPTPNQPAVLAYLEQDGRLGRHTKQWPGLVAAARQGNWMASFQVYVALGEAGEDDLVAHYRRLQLMEWLIEKRVGALYFAYISELEGSGYFDGDTPAIVNLVKTYAAMHGSYSAMDQVGSALTNSDDPQARLLGKRMRACARETMPALFRL